LSLDRIQPKENQSDQHPETSVKPRPTDRLTIQHPANQKPLISALIVQPIALTIQHPANQKPLFSALIVRPIALTIQHPANQKPLMSVQANKHPPISIESIAADHLVQVTQGLPCLPFASLTPKIVPLEKDNSISWTRLSVPITSKKPRGNRFKKLPAWRENAAFSELLSYQRAASPTKLWLFLIIVSFGVHPRCGNK